jgi:hypothetical protein
VRGERVVGAIFGVLEGNANTLTVNGDFYADGATISGTLIGIEPFGFGEILDSTLSDVDLTVRNGGYADLGSNTIVFSAPGAVTFVPNAFGSVIGNLFQSTGPADTALRGLRVEVEGHETRRS